MNNLIDKTAIEDEATSDSSDLSAFTTAYSEDDTKSLDEMNPTELTNVQNQILANLELKNKELESNKRSGPLDISKSKLGSFRGKLKSSSSNNNNSNKKRTNENSILEEQNESPESSGSGGNDNNKQSMMVEKSTSSPLVSTPRTNTAVDNKTRRRGGTINRASLIGTRDQPIAIDVPDMQRVVVPGILDAKDDASTENPESTPRSVGGGKKEPATSKTQQTSHKISTRKDKIDSSTMQILEEIGSSLENIQKRQDHSYNLIGSVFDTQGKLFGILEAILKKVTTGSFEASGEGGGSLDHSGSAQYLHQSILAIAKDNVAMVEVLKAVKEQSKDGIERVEQKMIDIQKNCFRDYAVANTRLTDENTKLEVKLHHCEEKLCDSEAQCQDLLEENKKLRAQIYILRGRLKGAQEKYPRGKMNATNSRWQCGNNSLDVSSTQEEKGWATYVDNNNNNHHNDDYDSNSE